jgi:hypothetical protein
VKQHLENHLSSGHQENGDEQTGGSRDVGLMSVRLPDAPASRRKLYCTCNNLRQINRHIDVHKSVMTVNVLRHFQTVFRNAVIFIKIKAH